jgi:hypothetical protein
MTVLCILGGGLLEIRANAIQRYRWKRSLDQRLKELGELIPKSHMVGLPKRVEELERALGRKACEADASKNLRAQGATVVQAAATLPKSDQTLNLGSAC